MAAMKPPSARKAAAKLLSPCVSVCQMDPSGGVCLGCYRTRAEITSWRSMDEVDQLMLIDILNERRSAAASAKRRRSRRRVQRLVL